MKKTVFGIVGGGWRADFFLRVVRELPDHFEVGGMLVRDAEKGAAVEKKWGVKTFRDLDGLLGAKDFAFVLVCVKGDAVLEFTKQLADRGVPVLIETPAARNENDFPAINELVKSGAKIQVAEQYAFQPLHAACIKLAKSGKLGTVTEAMVSVAHGIHGVSLIRKLLGAGFDNAKIRTRKFTAPLIAGGSRDGSPVEEKIMNSAQTISHLDFGDRLGIFDFSVGQYFSWIRSQRVLVRGERGEISNCTVRYLKDFATPISYDFVRRDAGHDGNLEGYFHQGILAGDEWVYRNPFVSAKLPDDEIAIATCLKKMAEFVAGGGEFYPLAEAAQDAYLSIMIEQVAKSGEEVATETQAWAKG